MFILVRVTDNSGSQLVACEYCSHTVYRPGRGASQVEKSPRLNRATQFLTVAYDVACSPNVFVKMA